eukprot:PITA_22794
MIVGYAQNGHLEETLELVRQMQVEGIKPDAVTFVNVLPICARLEILKHGKEIHSYIVRNELDSYVNVGTSLVDISAKCWNIDYARQLFEKMSKIDVVSWNAMIAGYVQNGHANEALELFHQMQLLPQVTLNAVTLLSVLPTCGHLAALEEGKWIHDYVVRNGFEVDVPMGTALIDMLEHYACMVNLLGRAGRLDEVEILINNMPLEPDAGVWGTLLGACRTHRNIELVECAVDHLFQLEPKKAGNYVLLSNIYATVGRWDGVAKMKKVGDVADRIFVLHDVEDDDKEFIIGTHSEKLAIAFGLLRTDPAAKIQITKNL